MLCIFRTVIPASYVTCSWIYEIYLYIIVYHYDVKIAFCKSDFLSLDVQHLI
jgi:hypothetical protein